MDKKELEIVNSEVKLSEVLLQLRIFKNLLISKGIFSEEEFANERKLVYTSFIKEILKAANVPGDLDKLSDDLTTL